MPFQDLIVTLLVLFGLFVIIYSRIKNQNIRDTWEEVRETFNPTEVIE